MSLQEKKLIFLFFLQHFGNIIIDRFRVFDDTVLGHVRRRQDQQRVHVQDHAGNTGHGERYGAADGECGTLAFVRQTGRPKAADGRTAKAQQQRGHQRPLG